MLNRATDEGFTGPDAGSLWAASTVIGENGQAGTAALRLINAGVRAAMITLAAVPAPTP